MWCIALKKYMWCFHWNAWAVDEKILRESLYRSILYRSILFWNQACHDSVLKSSEQICMSRNFWMQNVWLKSRTRDVCGRFVVAVSFADGNVRANGACDRVIRLCLCTFAFCSISIATMFAHLCLQLRSSTASWCRAYFVSQRADALHWIVRWSWYWAWSCALLRFFSISIATMFAHLCLQLRSPSGKSVCV